MLSARTVKVGARKPGTIVVRKAGQSMSYSCATGPCELQPDVAPAEGDRIID